MKKALILGLSLVLVVGVGVLLKTDLVKAEGAVISNISINKITENAFYVRWATNISTTGKVIYGTTTGIYTDTTQITNQGTEHSVNITNLQYTTKYYFKIVATDLNGNETKSDELSYTTEEQNLVLKKAEVNDIGSTIASIDIVTNKSAHYSIVHGTASGSLTVTDYGELSYSGMGGTTNNTLFLKNLKPNTKYYFKVTATRSEFYHGENESVTSEEKSFTTLGTPKINSIDPEKGPAETVVTINGENFGNGPADLRMRTHIVSVGCTYEKYAKDYCVAELISWSDTQIKFKTNTSSKTGLIYVSKQYEGTFGDFNYFTISGPTFTVLGGKPANVNATIATNYVTSAYGCNFSTFVSDENTIKVSTLFIKESDTDKYLSQVYNLYQQSWGRVPRCSEMQFHLDHSTPIVRLTQWLENQAITNKYGCDYSTTLSNENTVIVKTLFTLDSNIDKYLNEVYNAYFENWGRYPRCSEMQFHLDHSTPIERLTKWLTENRPQVTNVNAAPTEVVTEKIEFKETDNKVILKDKTQKLKIEQDKQLTFTGTTIPNAFVTLTISSEPTIATTVSNDKGEWLYALPGPLEIGNHTIKIAVSDKYGKKVSESELVKFSIVSGAKAVTPISITEFVKDNTTTWLVVIVVVALIVIVIVYFLARKKPQTLAGPKK